MSTPEVTPETLREARLSDIRNGCGWCDHASDRHALDRTGQHLGQCSDCDCNPRLAGDRADAAMKSVPIPASLPDPEAVVKAWARTVWPTLAVDGDDPSVPRRRRS